MSEAITLLKEQIKRRQAVLADDKDSLNSAMQTVNKWKTICKNEEQLIKGLESSVKKLEVKPKGKKDEKSKKRQTKRINKSSVQKGNKG